MPNESSQVKIASPIGIQVAHVAGASSCLTLTVCVCQRILRGNFLHRYIERQNNYLHFKAAMDALVFGPLLERIHRYPGNQMPDTCKVVAAFQESRDTLFPPPDNIGQVV